MGTFYDENGILTLDETVMEMTSFKNIMADGIVTDSELEEQVRLVNDQLHEVERACTPSQLVLIKDLLAEMGVLYAVYHFKELQTLK